MLNANIPLQAQGPEDVLTRFAKLQQIQGLQNQNQAAQLQFQQLQRQNEQQNKLAELLKQSYETPEAREQAVLQSGNLEAYSKLAKDRRELMKTDAETQAKQLEAAHKRTDLVGQAAGFLRQNPTLENALSGLDTLLSNGVISQEQAIANKQKLMANPSPDFIRQMAEQAYQSAVSAKDQLNQFQTRNSGATTDTLALNPVSGQAKVVNSITNTQSPDSRATQATTMRGQNMVDARARETNEINRQGKVAETSTSLRKEFEALPEVKNYKQALPSYKGIEDAATRNTPMSDVNIVYGIAKLYDPNSVVREGEYATVANSPAIPERIKGYAQYLAGGGKLTATVKAQILAEAKSRMSTYEDQYSQARKNYEDIAARSKADPTLLFPSAHKPAFSSIVDFSNMPKSAAGSKVIDFGSLK